MQIMSISSSASSLSASSSFSSSSSSSFLLPLNHLLLLHFPPPPPPSSYSSSSSSSSPSPLQRPRRIPGRAAPFPFAVGLEHRSPVVEQRRAAASVFGQHDALPEAERRRRPIDVDPVNVRRAKAEMSIADQTRKIHVVEPGGRGARGWGREGEGGGSKVLSFSD